MLITSNLWRAVAIAAFFGAGAYSNYAWAYAACIILVLENIPEAVGRIVQHYQGVSAYEARENREFLCRYVENEIYKLSDKIDALSNDIYELSKTCRETPWAAPVKSLQDTLDAVQFDLEQTLPDVRDRVRNIDEKIPEPPSHVDDDWQSGR